MGHQGYGKLGVRNEIDKQGFTDYTLDVNRVHLLPTCWREGLIFQKDFERAIKSLKQEKETTAIKTNKKEL